MLYKETVSAATLELLVRLMADKKLNQFVLVGGTSLSLQIGHRISVDLDLFANAPFNENELSAYLISDYEMELDFLARNTIKGEINGIQIDCITHEYPWVQEFAVEENIRFAGLHDIAAMKLNAISGNGTRIKDFIDIAFLSSYMSFLEMLEAYKTKYKSNLLIPVKSITFFDDINFDEPIKMFHSRFEWKKIAKRLLEMQKYPDKRFSK